MPDGVYTELAGGGVAFHPLPPPTDDEIAALAARIARRTARIFATPPLSIAPARASPARFDDFA